MNSDQEKLELARRHLDGTATADETRALEELLRTDAPFRRQFLRYTNVDAALGSGRLSAAPVVQPAQVVHHPAWFGWFQWRPLTVAAAGLVFGAFTASVVWAYVTPLAAKATTLLAEDFETTSAPVRTGVALEPGVWRGDFAEIVGEEHGVKPASGVRMLRFLRANYDGKARAAGGHLADVYRLIDVRPQRSELADGGAVVQVSAGFNAVPFPPDEKFGCALSIYALDAETAPSGPKRIGTALMSDSLAMARSSRTRLDRAPATWQRLTTELRVPANTDYLVVRLHITQGFDLDGRATFTGAYADDVRVELVRRTLLR